MLHFRNKIQPDDPQIIAQIAASTGFFDSRDVQHNVDIANRLLQHQDICHQFMFAEYEGKTVAYLCFAELPDAKAGTYELYWLSTLNEYRGRGIGRCLVEHLIEHLKSLGAQRLYVKTDSTPQYAPTRRFYEKCGFTLGAVLHGYYSSDDDCCIYCLNLEPASFAAYDVRYAAAE